MAGRQRLATVVATVAVEEMLELQCHRCRRCCRCCRLTSWRLIHHERLMKMAAAAAADGDGGESRRTVAAGGRWEGGGCGSDGVARGALKAQGGCMGASRPWRREARERWVALQSCSFVWCGFSRVAPSFGVVSPELLLRLPHFFCPLFPTFLRDTVRGQGACPSLLSSPHDN